MVSCSKIDCATVFKINLCGPDNYRGSRSGSCLMVEGKETIENRVRRIRDDKSMVLRFLYYNELSQSDKVCWRRCDSCSAGEQGRLNFFIYSYDDVRVD